MNAKQQKFVQEYLKDCNATQAAIRAGYSKKTAGVQGHTLLKKLKISEAVKKGTAQGAMDAAEVLERLAAHARGAEKDADQIRALELLGKRHKLFTDKMEHEVHAGPAELVLASQRIREGR